MKNYDPNMRRGTHTIKVSFQRWEYKGFVTFRRGGNCKGLDVLVLDEDDLYDQTLTDNPIGFGLLPEDDEGNEWFKMTLTNDNGVEVGTEKSTKIGLPKAQNLSMKDSRLNQFKENDQSFVHQSPAGTVQMKPSRLPENGNLTTVSYNLAESGETGNASVQNIVTREAAPEPIQKVHTGYKPANVAFTTPTKINVTRETKNRNNELKEQLLKDIKP